MTFAILVRDLDDAPGDDVRVLAQDIESGAAARYLAGRLACSYPVSGRAVGSGLHWFADGAGYHQIWAEEMAEPATDGVASAPRARSGANGYPRVPLSVPGFPHHLAFRVRRLLQQAVPGAKDARRA